MDFSSIPATSFVGKLLRFPLRLLPGGAIVPVLQGRLRGRKWIVGSGNHGYWLGTYEHAKRLAFEQTITPGSVVFDIGSNVGFYALLASVLVGEKGKVYAFEPLPRNVRFLREHVRLNHADNVTIFEAAVSDREGTAAFDDRQGPFMGHVAADGRLQVATVCLDEMIAQKLLPLPDFVKIDVEGAEVLVLTGARSVLEKARPVLFVATHSPELHRQCCEMLRDSGYRLSALDGRSVDATDELLARHGA